MKGLKIAIYGGFPPPVTGQTLSNRVLSDYLHNKGYQIKRYNTAVAFNRMGKITLGKIIDGLALAYRFLRDSAGIDLAYITMSQSGRGFLKFLPAIMICRRKNIPYIIHLHGNLLPRTFERSGAKMRQLILNALSNSKAVILLSESLKREKLYQSLSDRTYVVSNFVCPDCFVSPEQKEKVLNNIRPLKLFYLGGLIKDKGILEVLKAVQLLKEKGLSLKLKVAGEWKPDVKAAGERLIRRIGAEYAEYLGFIAGEKKRSLLLESHIFLLPTYYPQEGQPISMLEALAGGNVIITTPWSAIPDIVKEDENGFFVESKNPEDIANKIETLYRNPDTIKRISLNNLKKAHRFTVEKFGSEVEKIVLSQASQNLG